MITTEPLTEPTLVTLDAVPTAVVRHRGVTMSTLRPHFDTDFSMIAGSGAELAGPAFAFYCGDADAEFDLDLGFPVAEPMAEPVHGVVTVEGSELPAGPALAISHLGAYGSLHEDWGRLGADAARRGLTPKAWFEVYVTEPTPDTNPMSLRTDLFLVL